MQLFHITSFSNGFSLKEFFAIESFNMYLLHLLNIFYSQLFTFIQFFSDRHLFTRFLKDFLIVLGDFELCLKIKIKA